MTKWIEPLDADDAGDEIADEHSEPLVTLEFTGTPLPVFEEGDEP